MSSRNILPIFPMLAVLLALAPIPMQAQYVLQPGTMPDTSVGSSYNVPLTVPSAACAYDWSIYSGTLPPGLNLGTATSTTSAISGTPGMPAQDLYTFTVEAFPTCDSSSVSQTYSIRVLAIKDSGFPVPRGVVGVSYAHAFSAWGLSPVGNGGGATTWSAAGLPPGLTMSINGQITGTPTLAGTYPGTVTVSTNGGARTSTRALSIIISDPLTFVNPSILPPATVGVPYSVTIQTQGGYPPVSIYTEMPTIALGLSYNQTTHTISGTPTGAGLYGLSLSAYDADQQYVYRTFYVTVSQPSGYILNETLPSGSLQVPYSVTLTSSGFLSPPTWSATGLPPGLALNPSTGVISGSPTSEGTFGVTISASNSLQAAYPRTYVIAIGQPGLDFTPEFLPGGILGTTYSAAFTATGGDGHYVFSTTSGSLPPGLILSPSGAVTGTPEKAGDFRAVVRVTSGRLITEKAVSMTVDAAPMLLSPSALTAVYTGEPFSQAFTASGGTAPYLFQFGPYSSIPPGVVLSAGGILSGTPTAAGTFTFSLEVSDAKYRRLQRDFTLVVLTPGSILTTSIPDATEGEPYHAVIETSGGTAPFAFDIAAGALPTGLVLGAGGQITGTPAGFVIPAAGTFPFTVRVTDANHRTTTRQFALRVFSALAITPDSVPSAGLLKDYSAQLAASGGQPGYAWQISGGALPDGIQFTAGAFRGAATRAGTFAFDVTVTDQRQRTATKRYSIVVAEGPSIQVDGTVPDGVVGVSYTAQFTPKGGVAPFRWSATGQLPPGLNLGAADGSIKGVPTTAGAFDFTLRLEDADGLSASSAFRITVVLGPLPKATISGIGGAIGPNNQITFGINTDAPFATALDGALVLAFQPDNGPDDPSVLFSNGDRRIPFTVPAGSTTANFQVGRAAVQTGTVAGLITLTGSFSVNGADVTPKPPPVSTLRIEPAPPVITRMDSVRTTAGFELTIYGFTTARQMTQARVTLTPAAGFTLASTQFTVDLGALFTTYYGSAASAPFGSQFKLVLPVALSDPLAVSAVSVTLVNSLGSSAPAGATL